MHDLIQKPSVALTPKALKLEPQTLKEKGANPSDHAMTAAYQRREWKQEPDNRRGNTLLIGLSKNLRDPSQCIQNPSPRA